MSKAKVSVLAYNQKISDVPSHRIPRKLAKVILLDCAVERRVDLIQLTTHECFLSVKLRAKKRMLGNPEIPVVLAQPGFEDGAGHGFGQWPTGSDHSNYSKAHFIECWTLRA